MRRISFITLAIALVASLGYYALFPVFLCRARNLPLTPTNVSSAYHTLVMQGYTPLGISLVVLLLFQMAFVMIYVSASYIPMLASSNIFRFIFAVFGFGSAGYIYYLAVTMSHTLLIWPPDWDSMYYMHRLESAQSSMTPNTFLLIYTVIGSIACIIASLCAKKAEDSRSTAARIALWVGEAVCVVGAVVCCLY
ncbi:hypothetical protein PG2083B_0529 [Bifidobacterium pseudolongum subsp. globosum]|uniref:hypothetical protein n=1 Tax=Bifidobacterium pseudolongum TaxID=1694 RepID=UPI0010200429|nr:hypothetical protein [Bifidobacterium pseudolongum]RYQ18390.1 hypothetical protein PG2083B_0529 [Bifidobacterium pseudolongum subsp. globosum]